MIYDKLFDELLFNYTIVKIQNITDILVLPMALVHLNYVDVYTASSFFYTALKK